MIPTTIHWLEPQPVRVQENFRESIGGHPLLVDILVHRGYYILERVKGFLNPDHYTPAFPSELPDLRLAADRLEVAIGRNELIGIWGDFDVDGQTSTTLLSTSLRRLGAKVIFHIPIRSNESHGINLTGLRSLLDYGVQLLLTCDTGITDHEAVDYARERGIDTIITDHHTLPPELPQAYAVVNPQRLPMTHPLANLCGVGCAYKLIEELYQRAGRIEELEQDIDLVAIGTIADLVLLTNDNRYLVQRGLDALHNTSRPALKAIFELNDLEISNLTEEHISFVLAPRMNALGRLGDANPIVDFLTTQDSQKARQMALHLEKLNGQRKLLCDQVFQAAKAQIENDRSLLDSPTLVLNHPKWEAGVIGVVASRLVEHYNTPTILISNPHGKVSRGSARSIDGINIYSAITANKELLISHGGHPMAAGFSIDPEKIPGFRRALAKTIAASTKEKPPIVNLAIDSYLELKEISLEMMESLDMLSPFGPGNPPILFASRNLEIRSYSKLGRDGNHLQLTVEDPSGTTNRVIWWHGADFSLPEGHFDLAYKLRMNYFRGKKEIQIEWVNYRPVEESNIKLIGSTPQLEVYDLRYETNPESVLQKLIAEEKAIIWAEGEVDLETPVLDRFHLNPNPVLVIWSVPPGREELITALDTVSPKTIYLVGKKSCSDKFETLISHMIGLIKYAIKYRQGRVSISRLAALTGQREVTIHKGIEWLIVSGKLELIIDNGDQIQLAKGGQLVQQDLGKIKIELTTLLKETAAYHIYFLRADPDILFEIVNLYPEN